MMSHPNPWDVSAACPPIASGQVPFYNPAQFQQAHSTGSAVVPSGPFSGAGHAAGIDNLSAGYQYEQGWNNNWNNFDAWPQAQGYNFAGYGGNYYLQQQHSGEPVAFMPEGGMAGTFDNELVYDQNWSAQQQPYEHYATQNAKTDEYDYDSTMAGGYDSLAAGIPVSSRPNTSQNAVHQNASHAFEDIGVLSSFFYPGDEVGSNGLLPPFVGAKGVEEFADEQLPAVSSFSTLNYQPSPFDELGDMKSPRTGLPEHCALPSSHSRQSSAGGGVQFLIGGSSSVSESQSRTDSPRTAVGLEAAACASSEREQDVGESRTVVTEHAGITQPHFTDAGSHKHLSGRIDASPVHSLPPQGTMTGTPASGHHRKLAAGPGSLLEHPYVPPDFTAPVPSDADPTQMLTDAEMVVHPEAGISEDPSTSHHPSLDDSDVVVKAENDSGQHPDMYASPFGSHPDSSFTPVGNAVAVNAAMSPGQHLAATRSAAMPHMHASSVCSAAGSDTGALDMQEIELDAMVDSGSPQEPVHRIDAGSNVDSVGEHRVGSGTYRQSVHDAGIRSHVHHQARVHRDATMSPATTLWENPEPAGVRLLPAPAASAESQSLASRLLTHDLPQNTDAGPSKSAASGVIHEASSDVHSAVHSVDDQQVPQTPLAGSVLSQNSYTSSVDYSVPSRITAESCSHTVEYEAMVEPVTDPLMSNIMPTECVNSLSEELATADISSASRFSHTSSSVPLMPLHIAVPPMSGELTNEGVVNAVADNEVIQGPQASDLKSSVGNEQTVGLEASQTQSATEQHVHHSANRNEHFADKTRQQNVLRMQNKNDTYPQGVPSRGSDDVHMSQKSFSQPEAHQEFHGVKPDHQRVPNSVSEAPDESQRGYRYRAEADRPRSRQDDMDQVSRRPLSRQDYNNRPSDRPHSRQGYDDWGYDRPHSRTGYEHSYPHEQQGYVQPRSRQEYEDPPYHRPRSRQGYDGRRDVHDERGYQQRPPYEGHRDRPSSRQSYHGPADRPRSRQEYDQIPRSRQDYEDWSSRGSRDHDPNGSRYYDNRYGNPDSYNRPSSRQESAVERRDPRQAQRYPDESFNRSRYGDADAERYDRSSWRSNADDPGDPRYQASQGYREDEYRRPRSRGGTILFCNTPFDCSNLV